MLRSLIIALFSLTIVVQAAHFKVTSQISFDLIVDNQFVGTITVGLFGDDSPKTVENFRTICTKGGDIVSGDGRGSISIYGKHFEDENLTVDHTGPGFIGMANSGPDKNGCQFYITTMESPWLNGKHTIFGKVVTGAAYVHVVEKTATDESRKPLKEIIIENCRDEPMSSSYYYISDNPYDLHAWIRASAIPLGFSFLVLALFHILIRKLDKISKGQFDDDEEADKIKTK